MTQATKRCYACEKLSVGHSQDIEVEHMKRPESKRITRREFLNEIGIIAGSAEAVLLAATAGCGDATTTSTATHTTTEEPYTASTKFTVVPEELAFSPEHVWVKDEGNGTARLGITKKLFNLMTNTGKVQFKVMTIPDAGSRISKDQAIGVLESQKMSMDIIAPISGEVLQSSDKLLHNNNVYSTAWILQMKISHPEELDSLLNYEEYLAFIGQTAEF